MAEPLTLAQAKAQCRIVNDTSEDALIESYIKAAREWVENYTGHVLVQRSIVEQRQDFGTWLEIHRRPVVSITSIAYTDSNGDAQTYTGWILQADRLPARIHPSLAVPWPTVWTYGGVTITYLAGYAAGSEPQALLQAMQLLIGHWYKNREAVTANQPFEVPLAVEALCDQFREPGL